MSIAENGFVKRKKIWIPVFLPAVATVLQAGAGMTEKIPLNPPLQRGKE